MEILNGVAEVMASGVFTGKNRAVGICTVQSGDALHQSQWQLNTTTPVVGTNSRGPFRWFQDVADGQAETEIPNLKTVVWDRGIGTDAGTCTLTFYNTDNNPVGGPVEQAIKLGRPGYLWPEHGINPDAVSRWGEIISGWENLLTYKCLIRVYQGWGGWTSNNSPIILPDLIASGNVSCKFTMIADTITGGSAGTLTLVGRDMAALLIDQQTFPPTVPHGLYPLQYHGDETSIFGQGTPNSPGAGELFAPQTTVNERSYGLGPATLQYSDSSSDDSVAAPGSNTAVLGDPSNGGVGHRPADSIDGNELTFALSEGASLENGVAWWEWKVPGTGASYVNTVNISTWEGSYTGYVCIMENGTWQTNGGGVVPGGSGIPFVMQCGLNGEADTQVTLPRAFSMQKMRLYVGGDSVPGLFHSDWGPNYFRAGIREVSAGFQLADTFDSGFPHAFAMAKTTSGGYLVMDSSSNVYAFGSATSQPENATSTGRFVSNGEAVSIVAQGSGAGYGYWTLNRNGQVRAFGAATWHGDIVQVGQVISTAIAIVPTHTGTGYWIFTSDGVVANFGSAFSAPNGGVIPATSLGLAREAFGIYHQRVTAAVGHPTQDGYIAINGNGEIPAFGYQNWSFGPGSGVVNRTTTNGSGGPMESLEYCTSIDCTSDGSGFWILGGTGLVWNFGTATNFGTAQFLTGPTPTGSATSFFQVLAWSLRAFPDNSGWWVLRADGAIQSSNPSNFYGGIGQSVTVDIPRNYSDLSQIIQDLAMWAGFLLYDPSAITPQVYGSVETTGIISTTAIGPDTFDKMSILDAMKIVAGIVSWNIWVGGKGEFNFRCVDEETEIFTPRGWLKHSDVQVGDRTLSYDPETGNSCWQTVTDVNRYEVSDQKMFSIESRNHSSLTTPNHRWWVESPSGPGKWRTSEDLKWDDRIPVAAPCASLPTEPIYSDDFVDLVAWWLSEGSYQGRGAQICQSTTANPENCQLIERMITRLYGEGAHPGDGFRRSHARHVSNELVDTVLAELAAGALVTPTAKKYGLDRHTVAGWKKRRPQFRRWSYHEVAAEPTNKNPKGVVGYWNLDWRAREDIHAVAPGRAPTVEFLSSLTQAQICRFVDIAILGDGTSAMVGKYGPYDTFYQKDPKQVWSFEVACILAGMAPSIKYVDDEDTYKIGVGKRKVVIPVGASKIPGTPAKVEYVQYSGTVWCPSLDDKFVWLARRDGHIFYTGNSLNIWAAGNYLPDGSHVTTVPTIDEKLTMTGCTVTLDGSALRSQMIITSSEPDFNNPDTSYYTTYVPSFASELRGINIPLMWSNAFFALSATNGSDVDQTTLAELLAIQIYFTLRTGTVTCVADPQLDVGDQVRIFDRNTSETYVHLIRAIHSEMDLVAGTFTYQLTTNWLGDSPSGSNWAIQGDSNTGAVTVAGAAFGLTNGYTKSGFANGVLGGAGV